MKASRDPFDDAGECKIGDTHDETIVQLAKNGRNLLLGNSSCFVFVLGVYGHNARIYRFDRSGVIVSKAFSYTSSPHLLGDFLWRLVHPEKSSSGIIGSDTTITRPTKEEAERMLGVVQQYHLGLEINVAEFLQDSRWIVASWSPLSEGHNSSLARGRTRCFAFGHALSQSTNLFSRATVVWRVVVEEYEERLFALKDSWRELCRKPEVFFYERILKYKGESAWVGLASFMGSLDLGEEQGKELGHRTCSATLRVGEHSDRHDRSHMRTLTYPVGRKLSTFTRTKQLVVALRAAIEGLVFLLDTLKYNSEPVIGHRFAFNSGVLHRDISPGNVLFADELTSGGFLHNLDYSEVVLMPNDNADDYSEEQILRRLKDMTVSGIHELYGGFELAFSYQGTYQFMAVDVLMHKMHERKHDLESFYWLLVWTLLRHTDHDQGPSACSKLFDVEDRELAAAQKRTWLETSDLRINRNEPLTQLLERLRAIFDDQLGAKRRISMESTYPILLAALNEALSQPDWPENDGCMAFAPYSASRSAKDASRASSKKRKTESRATSTSSKRQKRTPSPSGLRP